MGNRTKPLLGLAFLLCLFAACSKDSELETEEEEQVDNSESTVDDAQSENSGDHELASDYIWDSSSVVPILLNGTSITVNSSGATANGSKLTITSAGTYSISGSLNDGQIIVNTDDDEIVRLILNELKYIVRKVRQFM